MARIPSLRHFLPRRGHDADTPRAGGRRASFVVGWIAPPVVVVLLLTVVAAVDLTTHRGQVQRNVELAGIAIGGESDDDLRATLADLEPRLASFPVELRAGDRTLTTTAAAAGLRIDAEATIDDAKDTGRDGALSPLTWVGGLVSHRRAPLRMQIDEDALASALRPFGNATDDARFEIQGGQIVVTGGQGGQVVDLDAAKSALLGSAARGDDPIRAEIRTSEAEPQLTAAEMRAMADEANDATARGLVLTLSDHQQTVSAETVRAWLRPDVEERTYTIDDQAALSAMRELFEGAGGEGTDAVVVVFGGAPVIVGGDPDTACCAADTGARILRALKNGNRAASLDLAATERPKGKAWAQSLGITELVGEFTTRYPAGQPRVVNIKRIAELTQGALIAPGATFSINEFVGPRTTDKGFVAAGSIQNGVFEDAIGGGISQYATTLFNAAFFAGLDYEQYQSHSIYINRYPYGREATVSFPNPDLKIVNTTPYAILIWPTATDTSITVQMYSTRFATGAQTDQTARPQGAACTKVTTERTRTYVDGRPPVVDSVIALYRPEGIRCSGDPTVPTTSTTSTLPPPTTLPPVTEPPTTLPPPTTASPETTSTTTTSSIAPEGTSTVAPTTTAP
jgi:vancomycin resistance protein YoaR